MNKPKVLVLDDELGVRRGLSRTLRSADFEVVAVQTHVDAWAALAEGGVAIVISDQRMPDGDGVDFLAACAIRHPGITRVLLTGFADAQVAAEAINRASVFRILWKPCASEELVAIVRQGIWMHELFLDDRADAGGTMSVTGEAPPQSSSVR